MPDCLLDKTAAIVVFRSLQLRPSRCVLQVGAAAREPAAPQHAGDSTRVAKRGRVRQGIPHHVRQGACAQLGLNGCAIDDGTNARAREETRVQATPMQAVYRGPRAQFGEGTSGTSIEGARLPEI